MGTALLSVERANSFEPKKRYNQLRNGRLGIAHVLIAPEDKRRIIPNKPHDDKTKEIWQNQSH